MRFWRREESHDALPLCGFVVRCAAETLPTPSQLVDPRGTGGALRGVVSPSRASDATLDEALQPGRALAFVAPDETLAEIEVRAADGDKGYAAAPSDVHEHFRLTPELVERAAAARYAIGVALRSPGNSPVDSVVYATELAARVARLGEGVADDVYALRSFGADPWTSDDSRDIREHITIHAVEERRGAHWLHTHGLVKFGSPEFEVYDVPEELAEPVSYVLNDIGEYVAGGAAVQPGHTIGDEEVPLYVRRGGRDRGHWERLPVLELVDLDRRGRPVRSGAANGLRAWIESQR
jgi:hypothetical protein